MLAARELADRLRTELGVGPAPTTRALVARLCGPGAVPAASGAPMFGRSAELTTLTAAWSAARRGRGRVVVVTGEAGIGKTRLIRELARRADNAGARVAVGAGVDVGGEAPLAMWQELARALVAVVPQPPDRAGWPSELGRLAPDLARGLGRHGAPPVVAAPELERLRVFDAVLRLVEWAAAGRPVLLVAEDVHRADRASIALCAHIGRRLAGMPVLFVLTRRDRPARSEIDALLADLAGRGLDVAEVELGPLRGPEIAEVVRSVAGDSSGPVVDDVSSPQPRGTRCSPWRAPAPRRRAAALRRAACAPSSGPRCAGCPSRHGHSRRRSRPPGGRSRPRRSPRFRPTRRQPSGRSSTRGWPAARGAGCATATRCWPRPPAPI